MTDPIQHLSELIGAASVTVAFTGAGMSTESGLADFRSPGGVWARHKPVMYDDFVASRQARVRYWKMRLELYPQFAAAEPNDGHHVLARLESAGRLSAVVTQNIDGLHQAAGSRCVIELHGTARIVSCIACGREWPPDDVVARIHAGDDAPDCDECGAPLKSRTISFGQPMPPREMELAAQLSRDADVYLAIGSSLVVEPAASLPRIAKQHGATLIIINRTETPLDSIADLVIRRPIGETLVALEASLAAND